MVIGKKDINININIFHININNININNINTTPHPRPVASPERHTSYLGNRGFCLYF